MNSLFQILKEDLTSRFIKVEKNNFFELIVHDSFKNVPEIEIEFWSSMISGILLENLKLELSSFIFFIINSSCLICLYLFPFHKGDDLEIKYSLFELIELLIFYIILFFCAGGSSLFYYKKFISEFNDWQGEWIKKDDNGNVVIDENGYELNFNFLKQTMNSAIIFLISCLSMLIKIELNFLIINKFHYSVNKRLFSLFYFLVYVIFFSMSFVIQIIIDYYQKDECFDLKCDCCNKCDCLQCCCCYKNKPKNPISVLKTKVDKCKIFSYIFYKEHYEKIEIDSNEFNSETDLKIKNEQKEKNEIENNELNKETDSKIENDKEKNLIINDTDLYDDNYSIRICYKKEDICDWFCQTFCHKLLLALIGVNFLINLQVIEFTNLYSDTLENMTYEENNKELLKYLYYLICNGITFYMLIISIFISIYNLCDFSFYKTKKYTFAAHLIYIIVYYDILIITYSFYRYFNWVPSKKAKIEFVYTLSIMSYNLVKIFWMNFLGQKETKDFLNFTGLLSLSNIIYYLFPYFFIDILKLSQNALFIIQIISGFICSFLIILIFCFLYCNKKYSDLVNKFF